MCVTWACLQALQKLLDAYSSYQSSGTKATYDYDGTTSWYVTHYSFASPLSLTYRITPPVIDPRTQEGEC